MKRNTKFVLIGIACVFVLGIAWIFLVNLRAKAVMEGAKTHYEGIGQKLSVSAWVPKFDPSRSNGATQMLEAINRLPSLPRGLFDDAMGYSGPQRAFVFSSLTNWPVEIRSSKRYWVSNVWDGISSLLEPNRITLREFLDSGTNDLIVLDLPYEEHLNVRLPHLARLKSAFELARASIFHHLHRRQFVDAKEELVSLIRFLKKYEAEPFLVSQVVRIGCSGIAFRVAWDALSYSDWEDGELKQIQHELAAVDYATPMISAIHMERAGGLKAWEFCVRRPGYFVDFDSGPSSPTIMSTASEIMSGNANVSELAEVLKADCWSVSDAYYDGAFYLACNQSNVVAIEAFAKGRSFVDLKFHSPSIPDRYRFSAMMLAPAEHFVRSWARIETHRAMLRLAIAIKRFRLRYGRLPERITMLRGEFVDDLAVDWFDGDPIRYETESDRSYRMWSVGRDGIDGGGVSIATDENPLWDADMIWPMPATVEEVARKRAELEARMAAAPKRP